MTCMNNFYEIGKKTSLANFKTENNDGSRIVHLTVNYQVNPICVHKDRLRFGWQMQSDTIGAEQKCYQLIVKEGHKYGPTVWDSGALVDSRSTGIAYDGSELRMETRYYWRVTVNDGSKEIVSDWAYFETGTDWTDTEWIMPIKSLQTVEDPLTEAHKKAGNTYSVASSFSYMEEQVDTLAEEYSARIVKNGSDHSLEKLKSTLTEKYFREMIADILKWNQTSVVDVQDVLGYIDGLEQPALKELLDSQFAKADDADAGNFTLFFRWVIVFLIKICEATNISKELGIEPHIIGWERREHDTGIPVISDISKYSKLGGNPLFRTEDQLEDKEIANATLYMTGVGNYEAFINGQKVLMHDTRGKQVEPILAPGATDNRLFTNYQGYDVTGLLHRGDKIALAAEMYNGYYGSEVSYDVFNPTDNIGDGIQNEAGQDISIGTPWRLPGATAEAKTLALRGKLIVRYADGTKQVIGTKVGKWRVIAGPVLFSDYYFGEIYDANIAKELEGWNQINFDDSSWYPVTDKGMILSSQGLEEISFTEAYNLSGSTLEPNNTAVAEFNEDLNQYPIEAFTFWPFQIVRPTDEAFANSRITVPTGNGVGKTHEEVFSINRFGEAKITPVDATNHQGSFIVPIVLHPGEVLSIGFGQNISGVVELTMEAESEKPAVQISVSHRRSGCPLSGNQCDSLHRGSCRTSVRIPADSVIHALPAFNQAQEGRNDYGISEPEIFAGQPAGDCSPLHLESDCRFPTAIHQLSGAGVFL